ncbi:MAG TPA: hypothetical protein VK943_20055 [Arenibaculum sp.]|nr:hypothetical protein [Arenibaculum sp.]
MTRAGRLDRASGNRPSCLVLASTLGCDFLYPPERTEQVWAHIGAGIVHPGLPGRLVA